jgi:sucrose-phosphate synthase
MLTGETLGVVAAGHTDELDGLRGRHRVFFASKPHAWAVLEGLDHYDFLGAIIPDVEAVRA